jgi:hypothetical protein
MFCAVKNPYRVVVSFDGRRVRVKPVGAGAREGLIYRTLARCEEFLAQVFLQERRPRDVSSGLIGFFRQRGWYIVPYQ